MKPMIEVEGPVFFSQSDETAFFNWLKSIKCIKRIVGKGWNLQFTIAAKPLTRDELLELSAVFRRYKLNEGLLVPFLPKNAKWATAWIEDSRTHIKTPSQRRR